MNHQTAYMIIGSLGFVALVLASIALYWQHEAARLRKQLIRTMLERTDYKNKLDALHRTGHRCVEIRARLPHLSESAGVVMQATGRRLHNQTTLALTFENDGNGWSEVIHGVTGQLLIEARPIIEPAYVPDVDAEDALAALLVLNELNGRKAK